MVESKEEIIILIIILLFYFILFYFILLYRTISVKSHSQSTERNIDNEQDRNISASPLTLHPHPLIYTGCVLLPGLSSSVKKKNNTHNNCWNTPGDRAS
jgi:hypothetical protein